MKAMIFAAGLGTRLRPLTDTQPKALIEVGGKAMLGHVIDKLRAIGVSRFVINIHHFPEQVRAYVAESYPDLDVDFSDESAKLLDTGGGLLAARYLLDDGSDEAIVVHNADILTDFPIGLMAAAHEETGAMATLAVAARESSRQLVTDKAGRLTGWVNHKTGERLPLGKRLPADSREVSFCGVHIVSPSVFKEMERYGTGHPFGIVPFYVDVSSRLDIRCYGSPDAFRWYDIGSPERLALARASLLNTPEQK